MIRQIEWIKFNFKKMYRNISISLPIIKYKKMLLVLIHKILKIVKTVSFNCLIKEKQLIFNIM